MRLERGVPCNRGRPPSPPETVLDRLRPARTGVQVATLVVFCPKVAMARWSRPRGSGRVSQPDRERAAAELLRVCRPGGTIALASWTPESFIGELFRTVA